jgi:hypothetical protein
MLKNIQDLNDTKEFLLAQLSNKGTFAGINCAGRHIQLEAGYTRHQPFCR